MFEPGQSAAVERQFSSDDIDEYVALGGARPSPGEVPGAMLCALFSYLLGVRLPGIGTNYLKQETRFDAPARIGDTLRAEVRVTRVRDDKKLVDLETTCCDGDGAVLCSGRALVYVRDVTDNAESHSGR